MKDHLWLKSSQTEDKLHISHIYNYISAYEYSDQERKFLIELINEALDRAKETREVQIVDRDGEMCLHITPKGYIILMLPWKIYEIAGN